MVVVAQGKLQMQVSSKFIAGDYSKKEKKKNLQKPKTQKPFLLSRSLRYLKDFHPCLVTK